MPGASRLPERVADALRRLGGLGRGVVAVSGGADSVALLRALGSQGFPVIVAHLNHQLRGAESDTDAAFVESLCVGLPSRIGKGVVPADANLEDAARKLRYGFLTEVAREHGAAWVATAHTLDDQAETVLHRLIRGTGLRGLQGIAPRRPLAEGVALLRPMLGVRRMEVVEYLDEIGQPWREDSSNDDRSRTRNRIRHELLPQLRRFNGDVAGALARVAEQVGDVLPLVDAQTERDLAAVELPSAGGTVILRSEAFLELPEHRRTALLMAVWRRQAWGMGEMTQDHWRRIGDAVEVQTSWDLPGGLRLTMTPRVLRLQPMG